jgi:anti-sigma B factor antagonist
MRFGNRWAFNGDTFFDKPFDSALRTGQPSLSGDSAVAQSFSAADAYEMHNGIPEYASQTPERPDDRVSRKSPSIVLIREVSLVMPLSVSSRLVAGVVIVDGRGRLGFPEVGLRDYVNELLKVGHRDFVLNFVGIPYIDSFGLGQLVTIWNSIQRTGGGMILLQPTDHVRQLLQVTRLDSVFHVSQEEAEALERVRISLPVPR